MTVYKFKVEHIVSRHVYSLGLRLGELPWEHDISGASYGITAPIIGGGRTRELQVFSISACKHVVDTSDK
jgi:hypothetical protein